MNYSGEFVDLVVNIIAAIIFLIAFEKFLKRIFVYREYNKLIGYYLILTQDEQLIINSPDGTPNFLKIVIRFKNPNVLITSAKDYDATYSKTWKTWNGEIVMDYFSQNYGSGYYLYKEGAEPGLHEIFVTDKTKMDILVRISDYGKANLKNRMDNLPSLQIWSKIPKNEEGKFNQIFKKI
jgi:hypothetical protein